jgi:ribonuclease R
MAGKPEWVGRDPDYERESQLYERPVPSRELILRVLKERGKPTTLERFLEEAGISDPVDVDAVARRFNAMVRDGQLVRNRRDGYIPVDKAALVRGRVVAHPDGFGFLIPDDGTPDLFLSATEMRSLLHGDRIVAHVRGIDRRGRREGALVEVLERANREVVGRYVEEKGLGFVIPDNKRLTQDVLVPRENRGGAMPGQIVVAAIEAQPDRHTPPMGRITEILGEHMAPGMEIDIAIRAFELPNRWPEEVEAEVASLTPEVPEAAKADRVDLRHLPLVTIDGADARDFDDAVYCQPTPKGWKLIVAIADVSHYVRPGSALDAEGLNRGNSVYFPDRVIPMLPEILSNGLCSLNPDVDRLAMACEMLISREGKVTRSRFYPAVMRSHARLIYDDVAALLDGDKEQLRRYKPLVSHLEELHGLYRVLRRGREARGAIDLDTTETRIIYGPERKIERIEPLQRNVAHRIIEECMLAANVTAAKWLSRQRIPILFRVHDGPPPEKLADLREFLKEFGLSLPGGDEPTPADYGKVLEQVHGRPDAHLIETVLLRSMSQAVYSPDNIGHFGLAYEQYTHFTSPIRRYPDLLVHRALRHVHAGGKTTDFRYGHEDMVTFGEHCSMTERRADEATRDAVAWLKCEFMLDRVGETFDGIISAVTSFGLFVELNEIYVEGLIHVTTLSSDYYHFDPVGHRLEGERSGRVYRLGDGVRARVVRVDLDQRKIDFEVVEERPAKAGGPRRGRKSRRRK